MTDTTRDLIQRLADELQEWINYAPTGPCDDEQALIDEARAFLSQPEPEEPTVMEIIALADEIEAEELGQVDLVRRALTRWGRPAVEPVLVSERLPGPEDCAPWPDEPDANHWCWLGKSIDGGWEWSQTSALDIAAAQLERVLAGGGWTHWLPHYALPTPQP